MIDQFLQKFSLHGNWVDLVFLILLLYFILTNEGFVNTFIEAVGFIFALFISYKFYGFFGQLLVLNFSLPRGISYAAGSFIAWSAAELVYYLLVRHIIPEEYLKKLEGWSFNKIFGVIAAVLQFCVIFLFLIGLVFSFPVKPVVKQAILDSRTGPFFVNLSQSFEKQLKGVFGEAVSETLNFITVKPESNEQVDLGVKPQQKQLRYDPTSEVVMFESVNEERVKVGKNKLVFDLELRDVARNYAMEMFTHGFFSHVSAVDGSSPADRANRAGISYTVVGENLAFAPDVYVAHQGLMNSQGHRENILSGDYGKVGIGVVDGGIYGKMFVQEFTN